jgi:hypothetical protein
MALGKLFDMEGDVIIPNEHCKIIGPIRDCMDKYFKDYPKIIAYLHYMKSLNKTDSPYADVEIDRREEQIIYDLKLNEIDFTDPIIKKALSSVEEKYATPFYRIYKGVKVMMDQIGEQLSMVQLDLSADGNSDKIMKIMEKYDALGKTYKQAYKDFEEEQSKFDVRGGGKLADDEDEDY